MKAGVGVVIAHCTLCYSQQILQSTLELVVISFIFIGTRLVPVLKQQFDY